MMTEETPQLDTLSLDRKITILLMLAIVFVDFTGFSFFVSSLPVLFFGEANSLFSTAPYNFRYLILGCFLATFSLFQAVGNYVLSKVIHPKNTRVFFLLSYLGYFLGYSICALACLLDYPLFLFLGNAISGFFGLNLSTVQAEISLIEKPDVRIRYFGLLGASIGSAFFVGSMLFSGLYTHIESGIISLASLFLTCALISLSCCLLLSFGARRFHPRGISVRILTLIPQKASYSIKLFCMGAFFFALGWSIFIKYFQAYLFTTHLFDGQVIAYLLTLFGLGSLVSQLILYFYKKVPHLNSLIQIVFPGLILLIFLFQKIQNPVVLMLNMFFISMIYGYIQVNIPFIGTHLTHDSTATATMALYQSTQALARVLSPLIGGVYLFFFEETPFTIGALMIAISYGLFYVLIKSPPYSVEPAESMDSPVQ